MVFPLQNDVTPWLEICHSPLIQVNTITKYKLVILSQFTDLCYYQATFPSHC